MGGIGEESYEEENVAAEVTGFYSWELEADSFAKVDVIVAAVGSFDRFVAVGGHCE